MARYRYKTWAGAWVPVEGVERVEATGQYVAFYAPGNRLIKMVLATGAVEVEPTPRDD